MNASGKSEYALAGVNYQDIDPFKQLMKAVGGQTLDFPMQRRSVLVEAADHGAFYHYMGQDPYRWCMVVEGLGNKNWIAEWMYQRTGKSHYFGIGIDAALAAVNDLIAQGSLPVLYAD